VKVPIIGQIQKVFSIGRKTKLMLFNVCFVPKAGTQKLKIWQPSLLQDDTTNTGMI